MGGRSKGTAAGLQAVMTGSPSTATLCGFPLQIRDEEPNSKKPELCALVRKQVIDYFFSSGEMLFQLNIYILPFTKMLLKMNVNLVGIQTLHIVQLTESFIKVGIFYTPAGLN